MTRCRPAWLFLLLCLLCNGALVPRAIAQTDPSVPPPVANQSMSDAWWTGPMLANSAETLPPGHFLFEPYLYDIRSPGNDSFGSRTYILYGLADRLSIGLIPVFGYNRVNNGHSSASIGFGDLTLQAQYRLTEFQPGSRIPTTAIMLQETLPTGRYDQLGSRPSDGLGGGAYTTTLALNSQMYFWMPNGRILRERFDISGSFSRTANVEGVSVYGTDSGFRGTARPGRSFSADLAFEYSVTQRWVLALDLTYSYNSNTRVNGVDLLSSPNGLPYVQNVALSSGASEAYGVAPAIEYNWTPRIGVLLGTRIIFGGHNTVGTVTPAIALNYVY
ncbi:transporter [Dyella psychrodurans]|uniref:Transporter n=1 Tax=Dyella psychrodurans TaxID=1927960 RepID=A0A370XC84_9GAMM|nr:transporter [Dyella psychrodurans]RDS85825.1 transporter [Dyella psychrodurans]